MEEETSNPPALRKSARIDGRHLRSERTRQLIVEAYVTLVRETGHMPTATQIAERAGYSVRSIFERFPDLTALRIAATDYAIAEARNSAGLRDENGDRTTRIKSQVETRARTCERWLPMWRVLSANPESSADLRRRIAAIRELVGKRMEAMFKPELASLSEADRRRTLLALEALTDFESWGRMIEEYGLSHDEACTVWITAIDRLLPPTPVS
ncbi:MAG: TetR/AcrR family transcriptional regulator [Alphaproteobacteria bacterium]|nr:TetR/AcrR family transcriptional regulator [Alphaproteobacteria bacterium]